MFTSRYKDRTQRLNKYLKLLKKIQLEFKYENEAKKQDADSWYDTWLTTELYFEEKVCTKGFRETRNTG